MELKDGRLHMGEVTRMETFRPRAAEGGEEEGGTGGSPGGGRLLGYVASRAHHSDVGGQSPGSMPLAREIYQEGLRIPPLRLHRAGERNEDVWRLVLANVRTPVERAGDLDAQLAALHTGGARLREIARRRGADETLEAMEALVAYADRLVEAGLREIPDGRWEAEDPLDALPLRLRVQVGRNRDAT